MAVNKVVYGSETLIDLTEDTATADTVAEGYTLHLANGKRATGTAKYAASPTANGPATVSNGLHYAQVDSTSTSTAYTVTIPGIDSYYDGLTVVLKNGVVTSAANFTVNVNGLGALGVYSNMAAATRETTIFNANYTLMLIYDSTRVAGGCWVNYRGYYSDANSIAYQVRGNGGTLPAKDKFVRYRLLFTSADGAHWVPANTSTSTNATSSRAVNQSAIDPFGRIVYYSSTTAIAAGSAPGAAYLWSQYQVSLGYSFNLTGAALTLTYPAPVYIKCAPQTNGSAIIDSTTPYVQALPTTADGKIYIFLGIAYNATNIDLYGEHPVYYHDGTGIRKWIGTTIQADVTMTDTEVDAAVEAAFGYTITNQSPTLVSVQSSASAGETVTITSIYSGELGMLRVGTTSSGYDVMNITHDFQHIDFTMPSAPVFVLAGEAYSGGSND